MSGKGLVLFRAAMPSANSGPMASSIPGNRWEFTLLGAKSWLLLTLTNTSTSIQEKVRRTHRFDGIPLLERE